MFNSDTVAHPELEGALHTNKASWYQEKPVNPKVKWNSGGSDFH